jgi:hypothetical protein
MALATVDELRVVLLETKIAAVEDLINNQADFTDRRYYAAKVIEHTPPVEE